MSIACPREVKIQLTSTAEIDAAELFVDGVSRGFVRKGIANTIQLPLGQHSFAMRAVVNGIEYKREKSEAIVAGTTPQWVFLHPIKQGGTPQASGTREVRVQLTSTAEVDSGTLFIDGVNRGIVRKGTPVILHLPLGNHKFAMEAVKDGVQYKREKTANVIAGTTPQWEFLHPIKQGGAPQASGTREVRVQLTSTAEVDSGTLFIDGVNRGIVRKGTPVILHLPLGNHKFAMEAVKDGVEYKREKTANVTAGTTPQWEFLHPIRQGNTTATTGTWLVVILDQTSPVNKANLTINGDAKGEIRRGGDGVRYAVTPGEEVTIVLTREWNGKTYSVEKKITVASGQTETVRLVPVKQ